MTQILAIAGITLRNATRSRVVIVLIAALLAATIGIPLTVKGDGTLQGELQVILRYSLGAAGMLLALATVWAGCAAVSLEIQHRRIHMVAVKPVRRAYIWIGSWLGLVVLNGVLLVFVGAANYGLIRWRVARASVPREERAQVEQRLLIARRLLRPAPLNVEQQVENEFQALYAQGKISPDVPKDQYRKALRDKYRQRAYSAATGTHLVWRFPAFSETSHRAPALLRFRFAISDLSFEDISGSWQIRRESNPVAFEIPHKGGPQQPHVLEIPLSALQGEGEVLVTYENRHERPITVFFDPDEGVSLLVPAGGFAANYGRALLAIWFHLIFLAALGTAMGTLFSMPVAAFVAWSLVFLLAVAGFMENLSASYAPLGHDATRAAWQKVLSAALRFLFSIAHKIVTPLRGPDPLDLVVEGIWLSPMWILRVFVTKAIIYSGLLALFSFWIFNRRELALPTT
jgi:hypothetical protein